MAEQLLDPTDVSWFADLVRRLRAGTLPGVNASETLIQGLEGVLRRAQNEVSGGEREAFDADDADALIRLGQQLMGGALSAPSAELRSLYVNLGSGTQNVGYALRGRMSSRG